MNINRNPVVLALIAVIASIVIAHPVTAQPVNKSNLWFGGDEGIEVVWRVRHAARQWNLGAA